MRYWWVNQNQTFGQETRGGYLWSPKRKANDQRNPFIRAIGIAESFCYECPKPAEFGAAGPNWADIGWKIDVRFTPVLNPVRPADHMRALGPLLAGKYAPLRPNGHGIQGIYLTALAPAFAEALLGLIGPEARALANALIGHDRALEQSRSPAQGQAEWEEHQIDEIRHMPIDETEKSALILARRGQGLFKQRVRRLERRCRITGVERIEHLRASHCKPWRDSDDAERLDSENGLLLMREALGLTGRGRAVARAHGRSGGGAGQRGRVFRGAEKVSRVSSGARIPGGARRAALGADTLDRLRRRTFLAVNADTTVPPSQARWHAWRAHSAAGGTP